MLMTLEEFVLLKGKLRACQSRSQGGKTIVSGFRVQAWGQNNQVVTIELQDYWQTKRYNKLEGTILNSRVNYIVQHTANTRHLPVLTLPRVFEH